MSTKQNYLIVKSFLDSRMVRDAFWKKATDALEALHKEEQTSCWRCGKEHHPDAPCPTEIDYSLPGVPINKAVFTDYQGKPIWSEEPYPFSSMNGVGEIIIHESKKYTVRRVAACEGVMYVNFERGE